MSDLSPGANGYTDLNPQVSPKPYSYTPCSGTQYGLSVASAASLTVPADAEFATVVAAGAARYTLDGTTPTASVGIPLSAGVPVEFRGRAMLKALKIFGTTTTVDVAYFK